MANRIWIGAADAVAQVDTIVITAFDAATTYQVLINDDIVSVVGVTGVNETATALQVALAASSNPYFSSITWTVTTDTITATASSPGNPHTFTTAKVGGTGTLTGPNSVTASSGPNDWNVARNWEGGVVPISTDKVIAENSSISITHGLDQSAVTLAELIVRKSFTGRIGLKEREYATTSDGGTTNPAKDEFREQYLRIGANILTLGENFSERPQDGSTLIKINVGSVQSKITVHDTAGTAFEAKKPAIQLLGTNASNELFVRSGKGSVGVAVSAFEVSTFTQIDIGSDMSAGGVILGPGVTLTNWSQKSGTHFVNAAATITKMDVLGGIVTTEGDYTITTINVGNGGSYFSNHTKTAGSAIGTLNFVSDGTVSTIQSSKPRTFDLVNLFSEAIFTSDNSFVTVTSLKEPSGPYELTMT